MRLTSGWVAGAGEEERSFLPRDSADQAGLSYTVTLPTMTS